ncbi:sensory rhodopsin transducer [Eoetvoesiella caeni]
MSKENDMAIGKTLWAIPEGYIPAQSTNGEDSRFVSHEAACLLNANDGDAHITITIYFADREPAGPYRVTVPARRTLHLRFNDMSEPETIPRDTPYSSVIESSLPIVVQHTRLDSRQAALALLSTMAYAAG